MINDNPKIMFISDIHIGTNISTNWYQKKVHEPYLMAALKWAQDSTNSVQELILLGDLVDLWTYSPHLQPPNFNTIQENNKDILGPNGKLATIANEGKVKVTYINGNHDMTINAADINRISSSINTMPEMDLIYQIPANTLGPKQICCTHGHIYSMMCARDFSNPPERWNHLPLGYFITRLSVLWCEQVLNKNYPPHSTSADMPDNGNPTGWSLDTGLISIYEAWKKKDEEFSDLIINALIDAIKAEGSEEPKEFKMPEGITPNPTVDDVKNYYGNLLIGPIKSPKTTYPSDKTIGINWYGGQKFLDLTKLVIGASLGATDAFGNLLPWEVIVNPTLGFPIMVMGHTHKPKDYEELSETIVYSNSGFNCPSLPDMGLKEVESNSESKYSTHLKHPSFTVIEWDEKVNKYTITVMMVDNSYNVKPDPDIKPVTITP